jgi:subtilisin family serine protease
LKYRVLSALLLAQLLFALPSRAAGRFIVRVNGGLPVAQLVCGLLGCNVAAGLDGLLGQVYLVTNPNSAIPDANFLTSLLGALGVSDAEPDLLASAQQSTYAVPSALYDTTPTNYFGQMVPHGYVNQAANQIVGLSSAQSTFHTKGNNVVVAIIDTGIDPNHPTLTNFLVPGYDFTRNQAGEGDETADITLFAPAGPGGDPSWVNQSTASVVNQSTASVVNGCPQYSDFGHGTMVAGIVHLVAPAAQLMPLKAFSADGTGYTSDIIRAIYWATAHRANVINMSFTMPGYSGETQKALAIANLTGIIEVASVGNLGVSTQAYPASYSTVVGVASTNNSDQRSTFSSYGQDVWLAAPGEGIVTTYPYGAYAAGWGTSFSTPFVAGTAALMLDGQGPLLTQLLIFQNQWSTGQALAHAKPSGATLGNGRLQVYQAVQSWRNSLGLLFW